MVDIADITDSDSLERWLKGRTHEDAVMITHRAAMRVAPIYWAAVPIKTPKGDLTELPVLRACLIAGVAGTRLTPEIETAAVAADAAAYSAYSAVAHEKTTFTEAAAAYSAYSAVHAVAYSFAASVDAASASADSAAASAAAIWQAVRADCAVLAAGDPLIAQPLWPDIHRPFDDIWQTIRHDWSTRGPGWHFWIKWYDDSLAGNEPSEKLLTEIALIDPEDWDKGIDHVNRLIAGIVGNFRVEQAINDNPFAWRLEIDRKTGKLVSIPTQKPDMAGIGKGIRAAMRDFNARCKNEGGDNNYGEQKLRAFAPVIKDLRRDVGRYMGDPLSLFDALADARNEIESIGQSEGFSRDSSVERLIGNLLTRGDDICSAAPDVLATQKNRLMVRLERYSSDQAQLALRLGAGLQSDSSGVLQLASSLALRTINDPDRSAEEKKNAWYFMAAVLPRGAKAVREFDREHPEKAGKKKSMGDHIISAADKANKLDKGVDAVQEAWTEGSELASSDWVTEMYSQIISGNFWA